jgi:hypothetical protein
MLAAARLRLDAEVLSMALPEDRPLQLCMHPEREVTEEAAGFMRGLRAQPGEPVAYIIGEGVLVAPLRGRARF